MPRRYMLALSDLAKDQAVGMYELMLLIRRLEERIAELYPEGEMRCPTHLSIGQEAAAVGVCAALRLDDHVYSTHRCHAHYLAKGGDPKRLVAELYGKSTGCAGGKGGSMHLIDVSVGMMGASAVVASSIPIALGSALAFSLQGSDRVAVAFLGDAGVEPGAFAESLNFSALRRLPLVFVSENNLYSTQSPLSARQPLDNIYQRGEPYGVPGVRVDGNDVLAVYEVCRDAVARCRRGEGPSLIEALTYRWLEHVGPYYDYDLGYRSIEELKEWQKRDPVKTYRDKLLESGGVGVPELAQSEGRVERKVEEAIAFAKESPMPSPEALGQHVY
jgi:pyruvate dehydrogenase E1 component alpha subunit